MSRVYNFSAGPAVLPEEVLKEAADEMLDYKGSGMSVMEMSHRSKVYDNIIKEAEQDLRDLMNIPDNYKVLFLQGGASQQFAMIPMNLMKNKKAGCVYGYVRVSSADQNEERQRIAMAQEGLKEKDIFMDKQSGKDFERPAYLKLLKKLKEGDLLLIESIDRLGRNYEEIIEQWRHITKVIRADIRVLDMPLLDTTLSKDLLGTFIADLVLQVLSFAAENERKNIRQRQREGIDAALARGVRFGRPEIPDSEAMLEAVRLYRQKKISLSRALDMSGIGRTTFYKKLKEFSA